MEYSVKWSLKDVMTSKIINITKQVFKVGRHRAADIYSENPVLSREQATLILNDDKLHVLDIKSCNGTFINDKKILPELTELKSGDVIGFGCCFKMIAESNDDVDPFIFEVIKADPHPEIFRHPLPRVNPARRVTPLRQVNPMGPVNPVVPVNRGGPVNPVGPVNPLAPVNPVGPVNPVASVNPVAPVNSVVPVNPVNSVSPVHGAPNEAIIAHSSRVEPAPVVLNEALLCLSVKNSANKPGPAVCNEASLNLLVNDPTIQPAELNLSVNNPEVEPTSLVCNEALLANNSAVESTSEVHNTTSSENDIECIEISDDENDDFSNSQIFEISAKIKQEQTFSKETIDPYFEIKKELSDLDYCDKVIPVDLTEDDEIRSDRDLLRILESEPWFADDEQCMDVIEIDQPEGNDPEVNRDVNHPEVDHLEVDHPEVTHTEVNNPKVNDSEVIPPDECAAQTSHKNQNKSTVEDQQTKSKTGNKYLKPPLIEPHNEKERQREVAEKKAVEKERKRKAVEESRSSKKLKTKNKEMVKPNRDEKKRYHEERMKKLREISEKNKRPVETTKVGKNVPKVKVSDGRGNFLLNIPTTAKSTHHAKTKQEKSHRISRVENKSSISDVTSSHSSYRNWIQNKPIAPSTSYPVNNSRIQNKLSTASTSRTVNNNQIQDMTVSSNGSPKNDSNEHSTVIQTSSSKKDYHGIRPDSTVKDRLECGFSTTLNSILYSKPLTHPRMITKMDNVDEEICKIVKWQIDWINDQHYSEVSPAVYGDLLPKPLPLSFTNYSNYFNSMTPLIMLELWQFIYSAARNEADQREPMYVHLIYTRRLGSATYLDCDCYFSEVAFKLNKALKNEDLALVEVKINNNSRYNRHVAIGYIKSFYKFSESDDFTKPNCKLTIVTKAIPNDICGSQVLIKVITNIGSFMKSFRTMKYLQVSPLCQRIINPNINDYLMPPPSHSTNSRMQLNKEQRAIAIEASSMCLGDKPGIYLIKGPPGTGKSTVIVNIVLELIFKSQQDKGARVLLLAPSNTAVDNLILKLSSYREKLLPEQRRSMKLIRIGPDSSISKEVDRYKLSSLVQNNVIAFNNLHCTEEYNEHLKSGRDRGEFLRNYYKSHYNYIIKNQEDKLLVGSNVICTTLNSCVTYRFAQLMKKNNLKFTCAIIDESTQCTELECLIPLQLGVDKFVLVGDPLQLPAVVVNKDAQRCGYAKSLLSRLADNFKYDRRPVVKMLYEQYRMRPEICQYPNKTFYGGKLRSKPMHSNKIEPSIKPYLVFNLTRITEEESEYINYDEVILIHNLLETLRIHVKKSCKYTIGIITPYRAQKELLKNKLSNIEFESDISLTINTVDSFQGMENDIIIISCVRYSANSFLENVPRLNVALTRAKQGLYIIGNYNLFKDCRLFYDLRENAKSRRLCLDMDGDPNNPPNFHKIIFY